MTVRRPNLDFHPVTPDRWPDLEKLFSASASESLGNPSRCWCMEWRRSRSDWERDAGEGNRQGMKRFVESGQVPGILAYINGEPAGWCSVSPRPTLVGLKQAGQYRRFEDPTIWVVICFYVAEKHHGRGIMKALLRAAVDYAIGQGAKIVEGYPAEPQFFGDGAGGSIPVFEQAGFQQVYRINPMQVTMRYYTEGEPSQRI